jgi:YegS/Rv2252/BmrU family lipid kinase
MKSLLIVNLQAGHRKTDDLWRRLKRTLGRQGTKIVATEHAGHAEQLAREAAESGAYDAILIGGGDGTINEVTNGIMAASGSAPRPNVGIVPLGTCNVLATELGIPADPDEAAEVIKAGKTRAIDIGRVGDHCFLLMAGFGFDADAVRGVALPVKSLVGASAYIVSGLAALAQSKASRIKLTLDEEKLICDAFMVVVANVSSYAFEQFKIAPFAALDDGWLDICVFERPPSDRVGFVAQIVMLIARRHLHDPRVRYYRARRILLESDPPIAGQLDGDSYGETPVEIAVVPKALNFFVQ